MRNRATQSLTTMTRRTRTCGLGQYRRAMRIPNEFTIQLCPRSGNLWVGGYDTDFISANDEWTFVKLKLDDPSHPHYNTFLHALAVGGAPIDANINDLGLCHDQARNKYCAVVDSGSTQMVFSSAVYSLVTDAIKRDTNFQRLIGSKAAGAQFFSLINPHCVRVDQTISREKLNANLPNLTFTFSSSEDGDDDPVTITVPPAYSYMAVFYDDREVEYYCNGIGDGGKSSTTLLGWAFMNTFTIRHDLDNARLGFIKTENCGRTAPPLLSFNYSVGEWSSCSAKCGGGIQWRNVTCQYINGSATDMQKCISNGPQPTRSLPCQLNSCTAITQVYVQPPNMSTSEWPPRQRSVDRLRSAQCGRSDGHTAAVDIDARTALRQQKRTRIAAHVLCEREFTSRRVSTRALQRRSDCRYVRRKRFGPSMQRRHVHRGPVQRRFGHVFPARILFAQWEYVCLQLRWRLERIGV